jgi:hypothetical protein
VTDGLDQLAHPVYRVDHGGFFLDCGPDRPANLYFIGGVGEAMMADDQIWNGSALGDGDDFDSSDPLASGADASQGGWDSDAWLVATSADNVASVDITAIGSDYLLWIATVLEVWPQACVTPAERSTWGRIKSTYR